MRRVACRKPQSSSSAGLARPLSEGEGAAPAASDGLLHWPGPGFFLTALKPASRRPGQRATRYSNWWALRMQPQRMASTLKAKHWLRLHGFCMGLLVLLVMWSVTAVLLHTGLQSMALRYAISLGVGYIVYLLVLRLWAAYLVRHAHEREREHSNLDASFDVPLGSSSSSGGSGDGLPSGQGGDFGGGGASGDWGSTADAGGSWADNISLDGVDLGGDEGALVVVPILAVFAGLVAAFFGFGALLWLYFGVDVLLSVAVELAFSMMAARALVRVERAGWLLAAVRLTWKPLLGALVCAVALGTLADWWVPEANTLREVLAHVRGKG